MRESRLPPDTPLAMEPERFRELGHELVDAVADFLHTVPELSVTPSSRPDEVRALLPAGGLPEHGADAGDLLRASAQLLFRHSTLNAHPRFLGYITASPAPLGVLADFLAAAVNPNCGAWILSPLASEIEAQTVRWIAELVGYPVSSGGLLVSGGNVANFTCFLAARTAVAAWDVRQRGLADGSGRRLVVYASAETHTWIQKATDLFGLGTDAIRWVPTDAAQRMVVAALREAIERDLGDGLQPLMVVGTAGSVSTGAVDPLHAIADVCSEHGIWFHVDGAYGGFAAAVPGAAPEMTAFARADSIAVDPHKWLYSPLEAGCALVRDPAALRAAYSYHPPYYHFGVAAVNYVDYGLQNSRGFRALKVWLALRQAGRTGYERMIRDDMALARRLFDAVAAHAAFQALTCSLSIATFRYVPPQLRARIGTPAGEEQLNRLNEELLDRLQKAGDVFVSNAVVDGRYALRACIVNFNTTAADVDALPDIIARAGRQVAGELRLEEGADAR
jgi:aromatic-L-amino-acid/L-tryptophan decarboxylase